MYLRHSTVTKNGSTRVYWRLVRSERVGGKVRQVTVAQLGELDAQGRLAARALAERIVGVEREPGLFEEPAPTAPIPINLAGVRLEAGRRFGDVWLGLKLWQALGLDDLLARLAPSGREEIPWATMAAVLVLARLCEPASELHLAENWYRRTALPELLGVPAEKVNDDRCYRALDKLWPHKDALEAHLKQRLGTLFALDYELLLYDVTSTYFEGAAKRNPLAQRGYSRDHRPDCKQVCIGLVVTRDGYPLGFEIFAGNRHDSTTLREIVERMETRYGKASRVWVVDRGMVSEAHLAWLRERDARYIVGTPKAQLRRWQQALVEGDWTKVRDGLEVRLCPHADGAETYILCKSAERAAKEHAQRERFATRLAAGLERISARCEQQRRRPGIVERQIGRLLQRNQRAARFFDVQVTTEPDGRARVRWSRRDALLDAARRRDGCYILRSNVADWSAEELWRAYMQLTDAEAAFRIHKEELQLRPVWHQTEDRTKAHILVCFLAYALRKTLEGWSKRAGLGASVSTLLDEIGRLTTADVILPTHDGRELRLRCVTRPDRAQQALLDRLGLTPPQRLRLPSLLENALLDSQM